MSSYDDEFAPLPMFTWDERPISLALDIDECATAIHFAHGDLKAAAHLLRVPIARLNRSIRAHARLKRILHDELETVVIAGASVPIQTLFDPTADQRAKEWASTKVLQSKLAHEIAHPLSPSPATAGPSLPSAGPVVVVWGDGSKIAEIGPSSDDAG